MTQHPHREICGLCHRVSPVGFWVPNEIWEQVVHHSQLHSIHCLTCFIERADEKLIDWSKNIKFYPVSLRSHIADLKLEGLLMKSVCAICGGTGIRKGGPTDSRPDEQCTCQIPNVTLG